MTDEDPGRLADQREREADELARRSDKLKDDVSDVRQDWQQKRASEGVPGAVPEEGGKSDPDEESGEEAESPEEENSGSGRPRSTPA